MFGIEAGPPDPQRAPVPLTGIRGCPEDDEGLCPFDAFVSTRCRSSWTRPTLALSVARGSPALRPRARAVAALTAWTT